MDQIKELLNKYNFQIPRYTSYPTAVHFNNSINAQKYQQWLDNLDKDLPLSLYLHIPFCPKLCWYCGCNTKVVSQYSPVKKYLNLLKQEIKLIANILRSKRTVNQIHFGGGSPTILAPEDFIELVDLIKETFIVKDQTAFAIEIDPRELSEDKVLSYAKSGVNRASLGVQDFNEEVQIAINRIQPFPIVERSVELLKNNGINHVCMDLIYGLPKQTVDLVRNNIEKTIILQPDYIALFSYAHVQWKKKHMCMINEQDIPNGTERIEMFQVAYDILTKNNYIPIGLDHFALKNEALAKALEEHRIQRNFQGYEIKRDKIHTPIIGLGISSISQLSNGYAQNTTNSEEYANTINLGNLPTSKGIEFNNQDIIIAKIIEELMCYLKVNLTEICHEFALPLDSFSKELTMISTMFDHNLVQIANNIITISSEARQLTRLVCSIFDPYITNFDSTQKTYSKML